MKKILSISLIIIMLLCTLCITGCESRGDLKLGIGSHSYYEKATNADGDINGKGQSVTTVAAVLVDAKGKIKACELDCADITVEYTADGKAVKKTDFKTKAEAGDAYGMKTASKIGKEWFEQADAFEALTIGKTLDEVKALVMADGYGNDQVKAGCTIAVSDFALAIESAVTNAKESQALSKDTLKLSVVTEQVAVDANEDLDGYSQLAINIAASTTDADGKITASMVDCVEAKFAFDAKGIAKTLTSEKVASKRNQGVNYRMKDYGTDLNKDGVVKEWFEQADVLAAQCTGKTAAELAGLEATNGYGAEAVQTAGCTIAISGMLKAVVKSATIG